MKELSLPTLIAVFEEMFGNWLLWSLVALALAITVAFVVVLVRERRLQARRLIVSEVIAIAGGTAAVWFVQLVTSSRLSDLGGPIDAIVIIGIWTTGAIGALVASYATIGLLSGAMSSNTS